MTSNEAIACTLAGVGGLVLGYFLGFQKAKAYLEEEVETEEHTDYANEKQEPLTIDTVKPMRTAACVPVGEPERKEKKPMAVMITKDAFLHENTEKPKEVLTYYPDVDKLVGATFDDIEEPEKRIGRDAINALLRSDDKLVYCRDTITGGDFEISVADNKFKEDLDYFQVHLMDDWDEEPEEDDD